MGDLLIKTSIKVHPNDAPIREFVLITDRGFFRKFKRKIFLFMRGTDINLFCVVRNFIYLYICINFFWTRSVNVIELKDGFLNNWVFAEIIHV
jgi:hypothetical protein